MRMSKYFERNGKLSRGCNSSFISLTAKSKDPIHFGDFRPIRLIGYLYKIIAKLLSIRLKRVIGSIIDEVQSAYVVGRNILEGSLIVNELWSWTEAKKARKCFYLKLISIKRLTQ